MGVPDAYYQELVSYQCQCVNELNSLREQREVEREQREFEREKWRWEETEGVNGTLENSDSGRMNIRIDSCNRGITQLRH